MKPMKSITANLPTTAEGMAALRKAIMVMNVQIVEMAKAGAGLYSSAGIADSMDKLHELAKTVRDKKEASPEDIAQMGACVASLAFMAAKPPETGGQI